jgi:hypothetical protein
LPGLALNLVEGCKGRNVFCAHPLFSAPRSAKVCFVIEGIFKCPKHFA